MTSTQIDIDELLDEHNGIEKCFQKSLIQS